MRASRWVAWARPATSPAWPCSCCPTRRRTSRARCCPSTVAGWAPDPRSTRDGSAGRVSYTAPVMNAPADPPEPAAAGRPPRGVGVVDVLLAGLYAAVFLGTTVVLLGRKA